MKEVFIGLGTNIGNRESNLQNALNEMAKRGINLEKKSSLYESEAWGYRDQPPFLNQVINISTNLSAENLLQELKTIEKLGGRQERSRWHEREIDLDILYYGKEIIKTSNLRIPHRYVRERLFVLLPLKEIAANFKDPEMDMTIEEITRMCSDNSQVLNYDPIG